MLCPRATWANATTFANRSVVGPFPHGLFVNAKDDVFMLSESSSRIVSQKTWSNVVTMNVSINSNNSFGLFVDRLNSIYVDNGLSRKQIDKISLGVSSLTQSIRSINHSCFSLFVDRNDSLYCSMSEVHSVFKFPSNNPSNPLTIIAGNRTNGSQATMLSSPRGIFLSDNFSLYVADCGNDRIQRFDNGRLQAVSVAGAAAPGTITLLCPTAVVLDADNQLFIVDSKNHRIVASDRFGFRCIIACSQTSGNRMDQLNNPQMIAFDRDGNLFVSDRNNARVQRFALRTNSCRKSNKDDSAMI